jgi:hypothetical protein
VAEFAEGVRRGIEQYKTGQVKLFGDEERSSGPTAQLINYLM